MQCMYVQVSFYRKTVLVRQQWHCILERDTLEELTGAVVVFLLPCKTIAVVEAGVGDFLCWAKSDAPITTFSFAWDLEIAAVG